MNMRRNTGGGDAVALWISVGMMWVVAFGTVCAVPHGVQGAQTGANQGAAESDEPTKSQESLASKTKKFATIAATSSVVKTALPANDLDAAGKLIGKSGHFVGTVVTVFAPGSNSIVILNFAEKYREAIGAVVKPAAFAHFPNLRTLKGKKVLVSGLVSDYKGQTQIELTDLKQVQIVK